MSLSFQMPIKYESIWPNPGNPVDIDPQETAEWHDSFAATVPNCRSYDLAFAGELAVIVDHGMREILIEQKDVFYYLTLVNENYAQPNLPADLHAQAILGCYKFSSYQPSYDNDSKDKMVKKMTLMGSGAILTEVVKAAQALAACGVDMQVISVTSWSELAREAQPTTEQASGDVQGGQPTVAFATAQLASTEGPIVAATDYVRAVPESIRAYLPPGRTYQTLGTDGFGRSDTRAALRRHFSADAASIEQAAWRSLRGDT